MDKLTVHPVIKVSTLLNGVLLEDKVIDKDLFIIFDKRYSKKYVITKLPQALWKIKKPKYTVVVEILNGDERLSPYANLLSTRVGVDSYP